MLLISLLTSKIAVYSVKGFKPLATACVDSPE